MKLRRRKRRRVPGINTASVADISFTLLILFLVVTSMDDDKGLSRLLPPMTPDNQQASVITERNVMNIMIDAGDSIWVDEKFTVLDSLKGKVKTFVANPDNNPQLPEKHEVDVYPLGKCQVSDTHVIRLSFDRGADYGAYFNVQNVIVDAYRELRDSLALVRFGMPYSKCDDVQRTAMRTIYPQRVSEDYDRKGGGI